MRRVLMTILATVFACGGAMSTAKAAIAADLCVGSPRSGCLSSIEAAVDAAHDGDTIHIGPGTFAGGFTIDKSVTLVGVSAKATRIEGGGPVITIGGPSVADPLTVAISGVTITGGLTTPSRSHSSVPASSPPAAVY